MSILECCFHRHHRQRGISLVELVMFVVIVGIGVAGILSVFNMATQRSADPAARKQLLAIAEAMLAEVQLMPFTCRDPDDPAAGDPVVALSGNDCTAGGTPEAIGPEGETRYSATLPFDNVNDYHGFDTGSASPSGIADLSGNVIVGLAGYRAQVAVTAQALGPGGSAVAANDGNGRPQSLLIEVTVTSPRGEALTLSGYRARHSPVGVP